MSPAACTFMLTPRKGLGEYDLSRNPREPSCSELRSGCSQPRAARRGPEYILRHAKSARTRMGDGNHAAPGGDRVHASPPPDAVRLDGPRASHLVARDLDGSAVLDYVGAGHSDRLSLRRPRRGTRLGMGIMLLLAAIASTRHHLQMLSGSM